MKISLNWLKKYVDINIPTSELITLIGARLVEVEEVIDETHKYDNIYIARVIECTPIPETHLHLCQIDIGDRFTLKVPGTSKEKDGLIQVVCGAPNVRAGMLAAWIAPGATVPQSFHEDAPFILGTRKLRGYDSNGMLAGADELDFGTDHGGIVEIDPETAKPGDKLADIFNLNDTILDVENKPLTRRPDTFGILGFAREVAGILGVQFKTPDFLEDTQKDFILNSEEKLTIKITNPTLCPRYTALIMSRKNDQKQPYLTGLQTLISRAGMRPIDPIVDMTNYLMLLTGQPLHAFDYDKLIAVGKSKTPTIIVRPAKKDEKLTLLDDKQIKCSENDILITSNNIPVALAGAMGCKNTIIDETTKKIIIESATFSLYNLRKTGMDHGIFSEAITRFTKGQPASNTLPVAKEFANLTAKFLKPLALFDEYPSPPRPITIKISDQDINDLLGTNYSAKQTKSTLENVGFSVELEKSVDPRRAVLDGGREGVPIFQSLDEKWGGTSADRTQNPQATRQIFRVTVPAWRTDIHIKEDIIEEIGRLNGFDTITPTVPPHATGNKNPLMTLKTKIREILSANNASEILSYSFIHGDTIKKAGQDPDNAYKITNSLSPDLQYVRQSLTPSLLASAYVNIDDGYPEFCIYEINQVYQKSYGLNEEKVPTEKSKIALTLSQPQSTAPFYTAKQYLEVLFAALGIEFDLVPVTDQNASNKPFEPKRSAQIKTKDHKTCFGIIGEYKKSVLFAFGLPYHLAGFELNFESVLNNTNLTSAKPILSRYPFAKRDITIAVPENTHFSTIQIAIRQHLESQKLIHNITPVSIFQKPGQTTKNLTFHLEFSNPQKTLAAEEINGIMKQLEKIK